MTPVPIAAFMASKAVALVSDKVVRVLEPAAGSGVLLASVVHALLAKPDGPERIELLAYEIDARLLPALSEACVACREAAAHRGVVLEFEVRHEDFLLSPLCLAQQPVADVVIANPPYFKLNSGDLRVRAHPYAVHGQANIYGLFMAACVRLLRPGASYCFITPRSWTNGPYFAAVRRHLLARTRLDAIHVFESRRTHFKDDAVLQEAMITWASACPHGSAVRVSSSAGSRDLEHCSAQTFLHNAIVRAGDGQVIFLPDASSADALPSSWTDSLGTLGLRVSTGPTVAFRANSQTRDDYAATTVPLLWMQHVQRMHIQWPVGKKREYIAANSVTAWMLLHNEPMVLLRRFSPKEDVRRMTAAPYLGELPGEYLGLENHLNYIYRPGGSMTVNEVRGLAALLNCELIDRHFRSISGNTQINATEMRTLPLPSWAVIDAIGRALPPGEGDLAEAERAVSAVLYGPALEADVCELRA